MLLDHGADPNARGDYDLSRVEYEVDPQYDPQYVQRWSTTLHMAVRSRNEEVVRILLSDIRTDVDALDEYGEHALVSAAVWDYVECARVLLGATIALGHLNNAAAMAAFANHHQLLTMLLAKGATLHDESSQI
jgi:hypothetical protein